jgi:regulator of sirC expression with transglutaminase-like and TPR domain
MPSAMVAPEPKTDPLRPAPRFEELASSDIGAVDVALGAALIARDTYEDLDIGALLGQLDDLARPISKLGLSGMTAQAQALELAHYIYERQGFAGNEADYYDPKNSLLPDVLARRLGIPITLGIVYCEIARRAGVCARGVGFPGHFLVRIDAGAHARIDANDEQTQVVIDPFFGGRMLDRGSLAALLKRVAGPEEQLRPEHLAPAPPRLILTRMLTNLKSVYLARGEDSRALLALDRVVTLTPDAPQPLRERGLLAARLGAVEVATADLARFLELSPGSDDAAVIRQRLRALTRAPHSLN